MKALIIANGDPLEFRLIRALAKSADMVVCADGGSNIARTYRIVPDVILGDFDSITPATKKFFKHVPLLLIRDQNNTDLEKAIVYCIRRKCTHVSIVCATGSRIDHTTGSLGCFKKFRHQIEIKMYDAEGEGTLVEERLRLKTKPGEKISLIPLGRCTGITTKNLYYSLHNDTLELGVREGISNKATANNITVSYKKGTLLLYRFRQRTKRK